MIYGKRVRQAREARNENQTTFAKAIGTEQSRLSGIENEYVTPAPLVVSAMSIHTGLPVEWFERPPGSGLPEGSLLFRARTSLPAGQRRQAIRCAETIWEHAEAMRTRVETPACVLPDHGGVEPHAAAHHVREALGLPLRGPIVNVVMAVEKAGVLVLGLPLAYERHDAFSTWTGAANSAYPLIALLSDAPGDRRRFSVAHELGHLVLHRDIPPTMAAAVESEADVFAAEFLAPLDDLADEMSSHPTLGELTMLKRRWGVSLQVLIRAARTLGVVNDDRYVSLFKQLSARGWRKDQPGYVAVEKPRAFRKMAELLYREPIDVIAMSSDAAWLPPFTVAVLDQHATVVDLPKSPPAPANVVSFETRRLRVSRR